MATAVFSVSLSILACCFILPSPCTSENPLHTFVRHFEHIDYNQHEVMHHHHRVRRSIVGQRHIKLAFSAFDRDFDLKLYPDDRYLDKNARIYKNKQNVSISQVKSYFYKGYDRADPSVVVMGNLAFGVFDGSMEVDDDIYYIEPSNRYLNDSEAQSHSIIYRHSDIDLSSLKISHPSNTPCGGTTRTQQRSLAAIQHSGIEHNTQRLHKRQGGDRNPDLIRCRLNVIADYKFYDAVTDSSDDENTRVIQATASIRNFIGSGSANFERQDFDNDGVRDGIQFSIFQLDIETDAPGSEDPFSNNFLGVESFLNLHSAEDWGDFCLSYRFTYRDFDDGVLGLAFVAAPNSNGGICEDFTQFSGGSRTLNTGIVTLLNYGSRVPTAVTAITFTHEAGHNFGSQHDPATDECAPSDSDGGKYVMFAHATSGAQDNNDDFSPCSINMMFPIIEDKGQGSDGCFTTADDNCGNNIVDEGEMCDCGRNFDTSTHECSNDPCCNGTSCMLLISDNVQCSPQEGNCCTMNCTLKPDTVMCREESDCALAQNCNGSVGFCPDSIPRVPENDTTFIECNDGDNVCIDGECTGTICISLGLQDCECTDVSLQCHLCCILPNGTCASTVNILNEDPSLLPNRTGQVLDVGFPCNNFTGYCDFLNVCRLVDDEGALSRLTDLIFSSQAIQTILTVVEEYFWAPIVGIVVLLILMFLLVLGCHFLLPRPDHMKKRSERRKSIRRSMRRPGRIRQSDEIQMDHYPDQFYN